VGEAVKAYRGVPYMRDHLLDVHRPDDGASNLPVVLLWHGRGPDERDVLQPLAHTAASRHLVVVVPDWRSTDHDGGNEALRASICFAENRTDEFGGDPDHLVLAGWSLGATAGLGLVLAAECQVAGFVGIASGYGDVCPTTGRLLSDHLGDEIPRTPIWLLHGTRDEIVPVESGRAMADTLVDQGARIQWHEFDTDHAGIVMSRYDRSTRRCVPSDQEHAVAAGLGTTDFLAVAASG
jgi:acetyl esterase/lipase